MTRRKLEIAGALGLGAADKRLEILRRVGEGGSISQAARDAGVSYKAAWQALDTLSNLAGAPLVERSVGGAGGGGARLTQAGVQLLRAAGEMGEARDAVLSRLKAKGASVAGVSALGLRTSMRNQLPCVVLGVERAGPLASVHLGIGGQGGAALMSRMTSESAQLLGLVPGVQVLALFKATAARVGRIDTANRDIANTLTGRVQRIARGDLGDEVAIALDGGGQVVGFALPRSGLRARGRAVLGVDASAVVVALPA